MTCKHGMTFQVNGACALCANAPTGQDGEDFRRKYLGDWPKETPNTRCAFCGIGVNCEHGICDCCMAGKCRECRKDYDISE